VKRLLLFEDFKQKNITEDDIIKCIKTGGTIFTNIVQDYPENNPDLPLDPISVTDDKVTVNIEGGTYEVKLKDITRVELGKSNESNNVSLVDPNFRDFLPQTIEIITSNGEYTLELSDVQMTFPKLWVAYHHSTPEKTGDVLTDGEPDYLGFDFNFQKVNDTFEINVENTYGDAMMFEFKLTPPNEVKVGHYNGVNSKFDPDYSFAYSEKSIKDLIDFFNRFTIGFELSREDFNFLDSRKDSYKFERVDSKRINSFNKFNLLG